MTTGSTVDPVLQRDIDTLALPGLLIGHRLISPGDEHALLDEEAASIASPVIEVRRRWRSSDTEASRSRRVKQASRYGRQVSPARWRMTIR